jgi:hypothetical protein
MYYVCEIGSDPSVLAGPFITEAEAYAVAGSLESKYPQRKSRIQVLKHQTTEPQTTPTTPSLKCIEANSTEIIDLISAILDRST